MSTSAAIILTQPGQASRIIRRLDTLDTPEALGAAFVAWAQEIATTPAHCAVVLSLSSPGELPEGEPWTGEVAP